MDKIKVLLIEHLKEHGFGFYHNSTDQMFKDNRQINLSEDHATLFLEKGFVTSVTNEEILRGKDLLVKYFIES